MKNNYYSSALIVLILIALNSCTTLKVTNAKKTFGEKSAYKSLDCSTTDMEEIDIFYMTDSIDFNYQEVGYVTAYAGLEIPDSLILKRLQYNSYLLCGNAVLKVSSLETTKDGIAIKQYNGVSAIIEKDSLYYTKYPFEADYSFYDFSISDYTSKTEEISGFGQAMVVVITIVGTVIWILAPSDEDEEFDDGI